VVDAKYKYLSEFLVSINRVFGEYHSCSVLSFELLVRSPNTIFEVSEIAFESFDVPFEAFNTHQGEPKESLVAFWHQR